MQYPPLFFIDQSIFYSQVNSSGMKCTFFSTNDSFEKSCPSATYCLSAKCNITLHLLDDKKEKNTKFFSNFFQFFYTTTSRVANLLFHYSLYVSIRPLRFSSKSLSFIASWILVISLRSSSVILSKSLYLIIPSKTNFLVQSLS